MQEKTYAEASKFITLIRRGEELDGIINGARADSVEDKQTYPVTLGLLKLLITEQTLGQIIADAKKGFDEFVEVTTP